MEQLKDEQRKIPVDDIRKLVMDIKQEPHAIDFTVRRYSEANLDRGRGLESDPPKIR